MRFDRSKFFASVRASLGRLTAKQVSALEFLLSSFESDPKWKDLRQVAYALATIKHETADTYRPITEYGGVTYFDKYDTGKLAKLLGNTPEADGDGFKYRGRGYVQITGQDNYEKFGIEDNPDLALDPVEAFKILSVGMQTGAFTKKKISDYINDVQCDYKSARKVINGTDKNILIAGYARNFEEALRTAKTSAAAPPVQPPTLPDAKELTSEPTLPANPPPINVENIENVKLDNAPAPQTVTVIKEHTPLHVKLVAALTALTGLGINLGTVIQGKLEAVTPKQFLYVIVGVALVGLAYLVYNKSAQRAHEKTVVKMNAAADTSSNNVELTK